MVKGMFPFGPSTMNLETIGRISLDPDQFQLLTRDEREEYYNYLLSSLREAGSLVTGRGVPVDLRKLVTFGRIAKILRFTLTDLELPKKRDFINNRLITLVNRGQLVKVKFTRHGILKQGQRRNAVGYAVKRTLKPQALKQVKAPRRTPRRNAPKLKRVYDALHHRVGVNYTVKMPSVKQVATEFKVSPQTAHNALRKLSATGLITRGRYRTDNYQVVKVTRSLTVPTVTDAAAGPLPSYNDTWSDQVKAAWFQAYAASQK